MTLMEPFGTLEALGVQIDLVRTQRDLAVRALHAIQHADTFEEARSIARGVAAAIDACDEHETIVITTRDYTADVVEEGDDTAA